MFLQQSQKCKRLGTSTYSMLTVVRRRLLQWTYFAELSDLPLERQEIAVTAATTFLPLKMAAASAYFRLFSIYVMFTNDVIVNARCPTVTWDI